MNNWGLGKYKDYLCLFISKQTQLEPLLSNLFNKQAEFMGEKMLVNIKFQYKQTGWYVIFPYPLSNFGFLRCILIQISFYTITSISLPQELQQGFLKKLGFSNVLTLPLLSLFNSSNLKHHKALSFFSQPSSQSSPIGNPLISPHDYACTQVHNLDPLSLKFLIFHTWKKNPFF